MRFIAWTLSLIVGAGIGTYAYPWTCPDGKMHLGRLFVVVAIGFVAGLVVSAAILCAP